MSYRPNPPPSPLFPSSSSSLFLFLFFFAHLFLLILVIKMMNKTKDKGKTKAKTSTVIINRIHLLLIMGCNESTCDISTLINPHGRHANNIIIFHDFIDQSFRKNESFLFPVFCAQCSWCSHDKYTVQNDLALHRLRWITMVFLSICFLYHCTVYLILYSTWGYARLCI